MFEQIFIIILEQAVDARFIHEEILYMDSTHIKANANKRIFTKDMAYKEAFYTKNNWKKKSMRQELPKANTLLVQSFVRKW